MLISTSQPIINDRELVSKKVAKFWNQVTMGWRSVWGEHIHHGFYDDNDLTPKAAQEKLIEKLTGLLNFATHTNVLDVGCGMGGSSFYLAKKYNVNVSGITLSKKQVAIAQKTAQREKLHNVQFKVADALQLEHFGKEKFDLVWSLESCEQFYDKTLFLSQSNFVLKQGGQLMLATWCSDREAYEGELAQKYRKLCLAFDLPYMPTMAHYQQLLDEQGFTIQQVLDWTPYVKKSWEVGLSLVNAYNFLQIILLSGWRGFSFVRQLNLMQEAFQQERVKYGIFIAKKK